MKTEALNNITIGIIAKNAADTLGATLTSVEQFGHIILVDSGSTDETVQIARSHHAEVVECTKDSFSARRNVVLKHLRTDWVFYVDADEIVTEALSHEIANIVSADVSGAYKVRRVNYFLGTKMYDDLVDRLFHIDAISGWSGVLHESPQLSISPQTLTHHLVHHTHKDIHSMLEKTNYFSEFEADLRYAAGHPPVRWWRLIRMTMTRLYEQFFVKKVLRYGRAGLFEAWFQMIDVLIVYTKLWEKQHVRK